MDVAAVTDVERRSQLDRALGELSRSAPVWSAMALPERRRLLAEVGASVTEAAPEWARLATEAKGVLTDSPLSGEEWIVGPYAVLTFVHALDETLAALATGRHPLDGFPFQPAAGGRCAVRVFPHSAFDRLLLNGYRADVWFAPELSADLVRRETAAPLRDPDAGGVELVLGAGNVSSIGPLDALYKLFAHNRVVLLKLSPVIDYLLPVFERALAPLVEAGFLHLASGDAAVGAYLAHHVGVDAVHMTGNSATHDAIVFGGADGAARGEPVLRKPMSSELGGISPSIVVPGRWSGGDLRYQAEHLVTQKLHNSGFNCIATQVVVLSAAWPQKEAFLDHLRHALRAAPTRPAYYPGAGDRLAGALRHYPDAERLAADDSRVLVCGLDPWSPDQPAFAQEYFAPVLTVTELAAGEPQRFLHEAVRFANDRLQGTLGAGLVGPPAVLRRLGPQLETAIAELRYGTVAVNCWLGVGYLTPRATWGAYPGHAAGDIQSGTGIVHNALLLPQPEKTVVRGPFRAAPRTLAHGEATLSPKPPWFVTNRTAAVTARRLTDFAARPRWSALPGIFASALRG